MKPRFTKNQIIYRIIPDWRTEDNYDDTEVNPRTGRGGKTHVKSYLKITKERVDGCGMRKLTILNDSNKLFRRFKPNEENLYHGISFQVFYEKFEDAVKAAHELIQNVPTVFYNGRVTYEYHILTFELDEEIKKILDDNSPEFNECGELIDLREDIIKEVKIVIDRYCQKQKELCAKQLFIDKFLSDEEAKSYETILTAKLATEI